MPPVPTHKYAGAEWLAGGIGVKEVSPLGTRVADLLGDVFLGIYHLPYNALRRVNWNNKDWIEFVLDRELATHDFNELTRLVVLAHDRLIRVSIAGCGPKYMRLMFHPRTGRNGPTYEIHPTIETAIAGIREHYGQPQE